MRSSLLPLLAAFAFGCASEHDLLSDGKTNTGKKDDPVADQEIADVVDKVTVSSDTLQVDIIFFGDTSGSMSTELQGMADNVTRFVDRLSQDAGDWHLMAVTTGDGCARNMLRSQTPNYADKFAADITREPPPFPISGLVHQEHGLYVIQQALKETLPGGCNAGFLRPDAQLHVIFISDEPDQSPGVNNGANYWTDYLNDYITYKDSWTMAKFSAVAGPVPGGCTSTTGDATEGTGYHEVVEASDGEFLSICDDWPPQLDVLADATVRQHRFNLSEDAIPETIVVYVNDVDRDGDWIYEKDRNQIRFTNKPPRGGDRVRIEYDTYEDAE